MTNYGYDHDGRLTQEQWMSGGTAIYTATFVYDAASRLTSAVDGNSDYAYAYNADDQVTSVDNSGTPNVPHVVLVDGYDNLGRRTSLSATVASTADFMDNFAYDALDRETQVTQQSQTGGNAVAAKRVDLAYNGDSQFTTASRYADLTGTNLVATSTYGYNGKGAITSLSHDKGATNLAAYTWGYDAMGRLTSTSSNDGTDAFTYDSASQVTAATHSYQPNEAYSYDANGNRTNTGYTTGTNNRLTSDGTYNYTYDAEGNRTRQTAISGGAYTTFTWDFHNRLTDVSTYTSANVLTKHVHYTYDVYDRLIGKQLDPTGGGTYTSAQWFASDGSSVVLVFNNSGTMTDRLLNGPGANQPLADENAAGTVSWLLPDDQGTIRDVAQYNAGTNTTSIVDHLKFDSFGNITAQSNSANQPLFTYTGQLLDKDTGLYYYHARWYDAKVGRFLSEDPTGFKAGDTNLTRYVQNDPANLTDPTGRDAQYQTPAQMDEEERAYAQQQQAAAEEEGEAQQRAQMSSGPSETEVSRTTTDKGSIIITYADGHTVEIAGSSDGPHLVITTEKDGSQVVEKHSGGDMNPLTISRDSDGITVIKFPNGTIIAFNPNTGEMAKVRPDGHVQQLAPPRPPPTLLKPKSLLGIEPTSRQPSDAEMLKKILEGEKPESRVQVEIGGGVENFHTPPDVEVTVKWTVVWVPGKGFVLVPSEPEPTTPRAPTDGRGNSRE